MFGVISLYFLCEYRLVRIVLGVVIVCVCVCELFADWLEK